MCSRWLCLVLALFATRSVRAQEFRDTARHTARWLQRPDARLHYLDWGGNGPPVILLPGYSLTAHAFDAIGDSLRATHHVVALTPRGFGESDAPAAGEYTIAALVADLRALLDTLQLSRVTLVGHSLSGTVAVRLALESPDRVSQLLLLDSFPYLVEAGGEQVDERNPIADPPFTGDTTYRAVADYLARVRFVPWNAAMEADLRAKPLEPEAGRRRAITAAYITDQWRSAPDVRALRVPSVQACAIPSAASEYPWLSASAAEWRAATRYVRTVLAPFARGLCTRYARTVPQARTVRLPGSHYLFFTRPAHTVRLIRQFVPTGPTQ